MLMSPDSSSSEVDPRPPPTLPCGPIHMIQVPECTQSTTKPQQIIHVDYPVKKVALDMQPKVQQPPANFHAKPPMMKSDEDLNLGEERDAKREKLLQLCTVSRRPLTLKKIFLLVFASVVWVWHTHTDEFSQNFFRFFYWWLWTCFSYSLSHSFKFDVNVNEISLKLEILFSSLFFENDENRFDAAFCDFFFSFCNFILPWICSMWGFFVWFPFILFLCCVCDYEFRWTCERVQVLYSSSLLDGDFEMCWGKNELEKGEEGNKIELRVENRKICLKGFFLSWLGKRKIGKIILPK